MEHIERNDRIKSNGHKKSLTHSADGDIEYFSIIDNNTDQKRLFLLFLWLSEHLENYGSILWSHCLDVWRLEVSRQSQFRVRVEFQDNNLSPHQTLVTQKFP